MTATVLASAAAALSLQLLAETAPGVTHPFRSGIPDGVLLPVVLAGVGVVMLGAMAGAVGLAVQTRRARGTRRRQLAWFFVVVLVLLIGEASGSQFVGAAAIAFVPIGLGVAMVRHGLFDGDRWLGPTLVYGVLTVFITAVFAVAVGLAAGSVGGRLGAAVAAAVVVAVALTPVRTRVQRLVDRWLYGGRRDPYTALTGLGSRLSGAADPDGVPRVVVTGIAAELRLPYVAMQLTGETGPVAQQGTRPPEAECRSVPIRHAGFEVASVTVGLRRGRRHLDPADEDLLAAFAVQAGSAVHAALLVRELGRSRDSVVDERDAERARIRRELHDGLGPVLAGVALGIEAATRAPARSVDLLTRLSHEVHVGLADVRRIVDDLRPSDLEVVSCQRCVGMPTG